MKKLGIYILLLLGGWGCSDDYVVYDTVDTMVCIPKNDFQTLNYDVASGADCIYNLYLYKGGYNDDGVTVRLIVDSSVLDVYNVENKLELKVLPEKYYRFDPSAHLSDNKIMHLTEIHFDTAAMIADDIDSSYVLPLSVVAGDQGQVRPEKNSVIIQIVMK